MSTNLPTATGAITLTARRLPRLAPLGLAVLAVAVSVSVFSRGAESPLGGGLVLTIVSSVLLYLTAVAVAATIVEGPRAARNRVAAAIIYGALALALLPLVSVVATLVTRGAGRIDADFFGHSMGGITAFDANGGINHAIIGTLEQVGIATLITVPLGIASAVYIVEYGRGRLATVIRFFVDVMTGIPSVVAGLFILAFWVLVVTPYLNGGRAGYSGFAAALALAVLMLPTVTRSTEEMLRLVPGALREGAYALGIPQWKTILRIVLPTARSGIVTGVMLAVARAAGETAPVLLVAGGSNYINTNPFSDNQSSLAIYIYDQASLASKYGAPRAWAAALTLVAIVLSLTIVAKLLARRGTTKSR